MTKQVKFEIGDEVKFIRHAYLYDGLSDRETHKISQVYKDGYVSFAKDERSSPWQINPDHIELVAQVKKETK